MSELIWYAIMKTIIMTKTLYSKLWSNSLAVKWSIKDMNQEIKISVSGKFQMDYLD